MALTRSCQTCYKCRTNHVLINLTVLGYLMVLMNTNTATNSIPWRVTESAFSRGPNGELHVGNGERTHAVVYFDPASKAERAQAMRDATLFAAAPEILAALILAETALLTLWNDLAFQDAKDADERRLNGALSAIRKAIVKAKDGAK